VDISTETPRSGALRLGEVVVEALGSGRILGGADGIELICRHIPAYAPFRLLFLVPAFRRYVEKDMGGCDGDVCAIPSKPIRAISQFKEGA